jgi:hypothetical protein
MKEVGTMITCKGGKDIPCVMKAVHYLRYYQNKHGIKLSPEMADKEAAKEGFVLDHSGETKRPDHKADREQKRSAA